MSNIDKQALREVAEKFRATYAAHCQNPRNYEALDAWDKATNEFQELVNNDELNIIASLLDELEATEKLNAGLVHNHRVHAARLIDERGQLKQRIAQLEAREEALRPVGVMSEKAFHRLEGSESRFIALWPRPGIYLPRKRPQDGVIVYARTTSPDSTKGSE